MEAHEDEYVRMWAEQMKAKKRRKIKLTLFILGLWIILLFTSRNVPSLFFAALFGGLFLLLLIFLAPTTEGESGDFWMKEVKRWRRP
ncbi:hypothetical protein [Thermococcus sp. GR6]|uniref:hypothetical protein n=1 Tax=Thermococcus sp. GR6 TaxID=1638256 RepID=UPI00197D6FC7|nr:hypothetical protein [Thermococcus sp. GR6]